jgi:hypothetical protein
MPDLFEHKLPEEVVEPTPEELLNDLIGSNNAILERVQGFEVNALVGADFGDHLGEVFQALDDDEQEMKGWIVLVKSYRWALALTAYPYRHLPDQEAVSASAVGGLFRAVNEYKPGQGVDFLSFLSQTLTTQMLEDYGPSPEPAIPTPAEFDKFVEQNYLATLPAIPDERLPEHIAQNETVLVMEDGLLVSGIVREVTDREAEPPHILNHIPAEELPGLQQRLDEEGYEFVLRDEAAGPDERSEVESLFNQEFNGNPTPIEQLHALGRAPIWLYARHPHIRANPNYSPSTAVVATGANPEGVTVEIKDSGLIPKTTWQLIISNPLYREIYLDRGGAEQREALEQAIYTRKQVGATIEPPQIASRSRARARPHRPILAKARSNASIEQRD